MCSDNSFIIMLLSPLSDTILYVSSILRNTLLKSVSNGPPVFAKIAVSAGSVCTILAAPSLTGVTSVACVNIGRPLPNATPSRAIIDASFMRTCMASCSLRRSSALLISSGVLASDFHLEFDELKPDNQSKNLRPFERWSVLYNFVCCSPDKFISGTFRLAKSTSSDVNSCPFSIFVFVASTLCE